MAGNLKPANVGPEMTNYVVNKAILDAQNEYKVTLGFFDEKLDGLYSLSYFYVPEDYLDITLNKACNIWATPHPGFNGAGLTNNAPLLVMVWDGTKFVNSNIQESLRTNVANEWSKTFANIPAGRYKFYCPTASESKSTYRVDGEWYFEEATIIPGSPTNLTATAGNAQVVLNWSAVTGATGYNVKRSIVAGGPYTTIASNVQGTTYTDTGLTNGTKYYYVVTAVNASGESANSNEASATPTGGVVPPVTGSGILRVTMSDSSEREYQLSGSEIDGFIAWFSRSTNGPAAYMLNKSVGTQVSKDYLSFDKIISAEVIPAK